MVSRVLNRDIAPEKVMRKYYATREFTIGEIDLRVDKGDELLYTRGKLVIYDQEFNVKKLEFAMNAEWLVLADGETPDPIVEKSMRAQASTTPRPEAKVTASINEGVETVNGVETLPDDWDTLHWTKKRAYLILLNDVNLLKDIRSEESEKLQAIIDRRLEELGEQSNPVKRVSMKQTNTGTPEKSKKLAKDVAEDGFISTSFGPSVKKALKMEAESFDSTISTDPNPKVMDIKI